MPSMPINYYSYEIWKRESSLGDYAIRITNLQGWSFWRTTTKRSSWSSRPQVLWWRNSRLYWASNQSPRTKVLSQRSQRVWRRMERALAFQGLPGRDRDFKLSIRIVRRIRKNDEDTRDQRSSPVCFEESILEVRRFSKNLQSWILLVGFGANYFQIEIRLHWWISNFQCPSMTKTHRQGCPSPKWKSGQPSQKEERRGARWL